MKLRDRMYETNCVPSLFVPIPPSQSPSDAARQVDYGLRPNGVKIADMENNPIYDITHSDFEKAAEVMTASKKNSKNVRDVTKVLKAAKNKTRG